MTDESTYVLLLRSDASHARASESSRLTAHLARIPGVDESTNAARTYTFGEIDDHGQMTLEFFTCRGPRRIAPGEETAEERDRCDEVEVRIPRPWVIERGPRVFALVFMLAEWAKWEVFDPQIGDTLQKEAVLSGLVAMRQAKREREARRTDEPVTPAPTSDAPEPQSGDPTSGPWWKRPR